jgi:hypothetical protein
MESKPRSPDDSQRCLVSPTSNRGRVRMPEYLRNEPRFIPVSAGYFLLNIVFRTITIVFLAVIALLFWPIFLVAAWRYGWPPTVPRMRQAVRYLRLIWTEAPPPPGLLTLQRFWLTLKVIEKMVAIPFGGLAWILDEVLYGKELSAIEVRAPLIEISAGRSGSTQLARYLEEDPSLAAPSLLQCFFPYLWLWRLAPKTLGRFFSENWVCEKLQAMMPAELLERHEADPFRTDTFDATLYSTHLNMLSPHLGPAVMVDDFGFGTLAPHNQVLWESYFVDILDRIARKTLKHAGTSIHGGPKRFFVKGHFLCAANALERRFPDAVFLTMVRDPGPRIQSAINYLGVNPIDRMLGPIPWEWLSAAILKMEIEYCEIEHAWFSKTGSASRCVIRFSDYVRDLEGTMKTIYRECFNTHELPPHIPTSHPPRERQNYTVNRSLEELGISETDLIARLADYRRWCRCDP